MNIFRSAVVKLTAWYVGALLIVCALFSFPMYNVAAARLRSGAERQTEVVRQLPGGFNSDSIYRLLQHRRELQLNDDRHELLLTILFINGVIVGVGAYASYLFARRTLKPIEEAHDAQTRFTADASHELRTPLAIMQTEIEVALRGKKLTEAEARDILNSNLEEVARLRQLSDQLLGLTRADNTAIKLEKVNLSKLVADQAKLLSKRHGKKIDVTADKGVVAQADKILITQVLGIIVENAFTYSGLDDPKVQLKVSKSDDHAQVSITNQGKTISKLDQDRLFDRFYRGPDATKANPKGHGLGLSLAKDIIDRHQGELTVTSSKSKGTTFSLILPAV